MHPQSRIDDYLAKGWWSTDTLDDAFRRQVARQGGPAPSSTQPIVRRWSASPPRRLTWNELDAEVTALAARLE